MTTSAHVSSWLLVALRRIRPRPEMYLRDDRMNSLACYITGVFHGREDAGLRDTDEKAFLSAFGEWLEVGAGIDPTPPNPDCWFFLVCYYPERTGHTEDFYRQLEKYLRELGFEDGLKDERFELSTWRQAHEERRSGGH